MFSPEYVLVAVLLTGPQGCPEPPCPGEAHPLVRLALLELAVECEILDPHEVQCPFEQSASFHGDLQMLRRRYRELANAPPLADCWRFPDRALVHDLLAFNQAYRRHLEVRQMLARADRSELQAALQETDALYRIWDAVRDVRCKYYYVTVRRRALKRLRELLGEEAYRNGQLPPVVPLWRFQEIDTCTPMLPEDRASSTRCPENIGSGPGSN